jgi:hypothetical protein
MSITYRKTYSKKKNTMNKKIKLGCGVVVLVMLGAILLLVIVAYLFFSAPRTEAELYGTYALDCGLLKEELVLYPDGTYVQTVTIKATSEVFSARGTWEYCTERSEPWSPLFGRVNFDDFLCLLERPDKLRQNNSHKTQGGASYGVVYWFGRLTIGGVDDWPERKKVSDKTD